MFAQPDEEEEFIVIKAGPPLPLRRPRTSQIKRSSLLFNNGSSSSISGNLNLVNHAGVLTSTSASPQSKVDHQSIPPSYAPQTPIILKPPVTLAGHGNNNGAPPTHSNKCRNKSSVPVPINKQSVLLKSPYQHPLAPCRSSPHPVPLTSTPPTSTPVESKVRQYIERVKKFDAEQRKKKPTKFLSLEDLYKVSKEEVSVGEEEAEDRLRQTLRIIKEKDEVILRLRESCHDLKLKWADAQNRVDEMRFGFGIGKQEESAKEDRFSGVPNCNMVRSASAINLVGSGGGGGSSGKVKSAEVGQVRGQQREMKDQATETDKLKRRAKTRGGKSDVTEEEKDRLDDVDEDLASQFGPVLEEKCSNWMEKVQNWKTDSTLNMSQDRDSCGDRDSGFRGSAELEVGRICRHSCSTCCRHSSASATTMCRNETTSMCHHHHSSRGHRHSKQGHRRTPFSKDGERSSHEVGVASSGRDQTTLTSGVGLSKSPTPERTLVEDPLPCGDEFEGESGGGHSLHIAPPWLACPTHVHPQSTTDYEGFPSFTSSYQSHPQHHPLSSFYAKSMDALPNAVNAEVPKIGRGDFEDSSRMLRDMEKRWKSLHPLLEDATTAALRVKQKSHQLSKILQKETEELKNARRASQLKRMSLT